MLSSKSFLVSAIVMLCLYFTPATAQRIARSSDSFTFAFFTDIHLAYNGNTLQYFDKAVSAINKLKPDFIITGGDNIIDATKAGESFADSLFSLYLSQIRKFHMPVHTGIGNHESFGVNNPAVSYEDPLFGKKMYESKIGHRYYTYSNKGWKFFMLDDIINTSTGNRYIGRIDDEQMEWLKKELSATDSLTPIVVCGHIPLISSYKKFEFGSLSGTPENDGVSNSIDFFRLFEHHNLKLILQGHFHFLEVLYANDIYYITGPSMTARWGNTLTRKSGFFIFTARKDKLSWKFIENIL